MIPNSINPNAASGIVTPSSDNALVSANATHMYLFTLTDTSTHNASVTMSISGCTGAVMCTVQPVAMEKLVALNQRRVLYLIAPANPSWAMSGYYDQLHTD